MEHLEKILILIGVSTAIFLIIVGISYFIIIYFFSQKKEFRNGESKKENCKEEEVG